MDLSRKMGWVVQAVVCLGLIVWQIRDFATAKGTPFAMALFNAVILVCALIGLVGAIFALRRPPSTPG